MAQFQLAAQIMERSRAKAWNEARPEWELAHLYRADKPRTCLCGHRPIMEICVLHNNTTGKMVEVGNQCIKVVLGLPSGKIFQALRRVRSNAKKSLNVEALEHALKEGWITILEYEFYSSVMRKRKLTPERLQLKVEINKRFIRSMQRSSEADTGTTPSIGYPVFNETGRQNRLVAAVAQ